jgi:hypothetical protein
MAALAHTKTLNLSEAFDPTEDESKEESNTEETEKQDQLLKETTSAFVDEINNWRRQNRIQLPHSWLIYNVMNKAFNQISFFTTAKKPGTYTLLDMLDSGARMFDSVWAAFGSFEKGETFGLPRIIANINMSSSSKNFEQHMLYRQNILPFLQKVSNKGHSHNFKTGSYTFALESHPLRLLIHEILNNSTNQKTAPSSPTKKEAIDKPTNASSATRLNKIINAVARELNIPLKNTTIKSLDTDKLANFLASTFKQCNDTALRKEIDFLINDGKVASGTPRRYLQYANEQYQQRLQADTSSTRSV